MSRQPPPHFTFEEMRVIWTALYRFDGDTPAFRSALKKANQWLNDVGNKTKAPA